MSQSEFEPHRHKFYKKDHTLPKNYINHLISFLKDGSYDFENKDMKATDWRDFETFFWAKCDREHLVLNGEIMLVDLEKYDNKTWLVLCKATLKKHKLSSGRVVHLKPLSYLLPIDEIPNYKPGYWLLPKNIYE